MYIDFVIGGRAYIAPVSPIGVGSYIYRVIIHMLMPGPYRNRGNQDGEEQVVRVILPNKRKGEMFGIVEKLSGASRLEVMCEDGYTRNARIPGKMKKRMWIREHDLVIVKPWEFQGEKADVVYRYTQTQANYLSRNNLLPEVINIFK